MKQLYYLLNRLQAVPLSLQLSAQFSRGHALRLVSLLIRRNKGKTEAAVAYLLRQTSEPYRYYRKIHYLTREFRVKLHAKTDIAMSAISVFKCNLTRNSRVR